jgi:hypothetical protein
VASGLNKTHHTAADFPRSFEMGAHLRSSTIKLPSAKMISRFDVRQVEGDRIEDYLAKGWSLGIVCKACQRLIEWTPPDLEAKFGTKAKLKIADLVPRLKCSGQEGCGGADIAVFPHLYDHFWRPRDRAQIE